MATQTQGYTTDDLEYLRHGDRPLLLRLYRPVGNGPFPAVIDLHGGAWNNGDRLLCHDRAVVFAESGLATAALDFRQAADAYPSSLIDINYAVRWLKAQAGDLRIDPSRMGLGGQSSGGHLAMLAAMRPHDPRYAALPLGPGMNDGVNDRMNDGQDAPSIDASVRCVGMSWPVINPLSRYRHALLGRKQAIVPDWIEDIPERQDTYWKTEDAMAEGNPLLALVRGEKVLTPPALWVNGMPDPMHDYPDPDGDGKINEPERFAQLYRAAGGEIDIVFVDEAAKSTNASFDPLAAFFRKHLG